MAIPASLQKTCDWLRQQPALGRWALKCVPDVQVRITIHPIGHFHIRLRRNRSFWLRDPLTHEMFPLGALQRLIRPGAVVYDVGANIGLYTRFILDQFGASQVICFEPMMENRALLEHNVETSRCQQRVQILPWALCEREGEEDLQVDDMMSGSATLDRVTGGAAAGGRRQYGMRPLTERVCVARLDYVIGSQHLPPPDVIKVDIEGAEALMLQGARETLSTWSPDILVELHGTSRARQVFALLRELNYQCFGEVMVSGTKQYRWLEQKIVDGLNDYYDLHFLIASRDATRLTTPVRHFTLSDARKA